MDPFFTYVGYGAIFILVIVLIAFGVMLNKIYKQDTYPPMQNSCPDYWNMDGSGNCVLPPNTSNTKNRGGSNITFDASDNSKFDATTTANGQNEWYTILKANGDTTGTKLTLNDKDKWAEIPAYKGMSMRCAQRKWANKTGLVWDGVTNYTGC